MIYTIYSIGDSTFLASVMNALGMMASTGDYKMAAGIGGLVGILFTAVKGLIQFDGKGIRYQEILAGILIYLTLFVPGAEVGIEDAYTGQVRMVSNVPLGPAMAGSVLSNLGYRLTVLFEQGFSTPSMTGHGFLDSLQILTSVRRNLASRMNLGVANAPSPGSDIENSVVNYVSDCTLTGVDLHVLSLDDIQRTAKVLTALRFDSEIYTTTLYPGSEEKTLSCTAAFPILQDLVGNRGLQAIEGRLQPLLADESRIQIEARLQSALDHLTQGQVAAVDYMLSATLTPMFERAIAARYGASLNWTQAAMVESAIQQRNSQWAAEETLFSRIIRPMLAWIEGFGFAVTPLMAFSVLLGARGIHMVGQYLLLLIWIQLWMPILAIVNLYVQMAAKGQFAALSQAQFNLPSMEGLYQMDMELQNWLGVGGMLAASTPGIALMLVYGGSITATHFLGRMQSGDFVDEKLHAPSLLQGGALLSMQHRYQHGPTTGTLLQGADRVLPHFDLGQELQTSISSSATAQQQTASQFLESLGRQSSLSHGHQEDWHEQKGFSQQERTQQSETDRFLQSQGQGLSERYAETGLSGDDFSSLLGGALSGSLGSSGGGMRAGLSSTLQNRYHVGESKADEIAQDLSSRINDDHSFQTDLARTLQSDASHGHRTVSSLGLQEQDLNVLQHSAQELISASKTYQEQVGSTTRFSSGQSLGAAEIGLRIMSHEDSQKGLNQALDQLGLKGDAIRLGHEWESMGLMTDPRQSYAAAGISLLTGHAQPVIRTLDDHERHLGTAMGQVILGEAFKAPHPSDQKDPLDHQHIKDASIAIPSVRSEYESLEFEGTREEIHERMSQEKDFHQQINQSLNESSERINRDHEVHQGIMEEERSIADDAFSEKSHQWALQQLQSAVENSGSPAEGQYEWTEAFLTSPLERFKILAGQHFDGFMESYRNAVSEDMDPSAALITALKKQPDAGSRMVDVWIEEKLSKLGEGLTEHQKEYLSAVIEQNLKGHLFQGRYGEDADRLMNLRETLKADDPEGSPWIIGLLERIGGSDRPQDLSLIRRYNLSNPNSRPSPLAH